MKETLKQINIIQKETIWMYTNMNTTPPSLHATIKLHKPNAPIRPIITCESEKEKEKINKLHCGR
jgi:hypothetical protein